jgi:hypothetical protein
LISTRHGENPLNVSHGPVRTALGTSVLKFLIVEELLQEPCLGVLI